MKSVITQKLTPGEVIEAVEAKLHEVDLLEEAMNLTQQELAVVKGRMELSWEVVKLRVAELRKLVAELKAFVVDDANGGA
jgi:hypothetical protein